MSVSRNSNASGNFSKPVGIIRNGAGGIVIVGTAATTGINTNIKIISYDSAFNQSSVVTYGDSNSIITATQAQNDDNGHYIISGTASNSSGGTDMLAVTYNTNGGSTPTLNWAQRLSAPDRTQQASAASITTDDNDNIIIAGKVFNNGYWGMVTSQLNISNGSLNWQKTYKRAPNTDDSASTVIFDGTDICVYGASADATDTVYNVVKYEQLPVTTQAVYDTSGYPLYAQGNLIMRFIPSVLNLDFVNDKGKIYGSPDQVLTSPFIAAFESKLVSAGVDPKTCYLQKLAPNYHTWDRTLISKTGDTIKIAPFWSSFLLIYQGGADEKQVRDSLRTLFPLIKYDHLNYMGVPVCDCNTLCANDSLYSQQYGLHDDPGNNYTHGNVNVEGAWAIETGKPFVRVGIFDTGINWAHEDFKGINGISKVVGGYDYVLHNTEILNVPPDSADFFDHGTGIAGIIGALRNNSVGIAGIAGGNFCGSDTNTGVSLFSYAVECSCGGGGNALISMSADISALVAALGNDSSINYSSMDIFNFSQSEVSDGADSIEEFKEKFYYAYRLGKIVVGASGDVGNQNSLATLYPAAYNDDWLICVGGSDQNGHPYVSGSVSQDNMDVIAPYIAVMNYTDDKDSLSYIKLAGTSFSAPYETGLAGLLLSHLNNPTGQPDPKNLAPEDIEQITQRTAYVDPSPLFSFAPNQIGSGRLDISAAMQMADTTHARLLHFDSYADSTKYSISKISNNDVLITLTGNVPGDTSEHTMAGNYFAEVWEVSAQVYHHISLKPKETIRAAWARSSSSLAYPIYDSTSVYGKNLLDPSERAYMDATVLPDTNSATIWGYYYKLKDSATSAFRGWYPTDITDPTHRPKFAYTVYLDTVTVPITPTIVSEIKLAQFSLSAFPNPAKEILHIVLTSSKDEIYTLRLLDALGREAKTLFSGKTSYFSEDYNIGNLETGIYFIQASSSSDIKTIKLSIIK